MTTWVKDSTFKESRLWCYSVRVVSLRVTEDVTVRGLSIVFNNKWDDSSFFVHYQPCWSNYHHEMHWLRRISQDGLSHHLSSPRSKFSHFVYLFHFSPLSQDTNSPVLALHVLVRVPAECSFCAVVYVLWLQFYTTTPKCTSISTNPPKKKKLVPRSNTKTPNAHHRREKIRLLCVSQSSSLPQILLSAKENSFTEKFSHSTRPPKSIDIQKITERTIKCTSYPSDPVTLQFPHISWKSKSDLASIGTPFFHHRRATFCLAFWNRRKADPFLLVVVFALFRPHRTRSVCCRLTVS